MQNIHIQQLRLLRANAYVKDSHFPMAALCFAGDRIAAGVNWEAQDRVFGTCGEMAAVMNLVSAGGPAALKNMLMMGGNAGEEELPRTYSSCAACRQFMSELDEGETAEVESFSVNGMVSQKNKIWEILPNAFVFRNYINLPVKNLSSSATITRAPSVLKGMGALEEAEQGWLHNELLNCSYRSFVPDQSYLQGAIIRTQEKKAYCGSMFQTANHKSSKSALTAALAMMISFDGVQKIEDVHFVHIENRPVFAHIQNYFPFEAINMLVALETQNIFIHDKSGISRKISVHDLPNFFCGEILNLNNIKSYEVPEAYRG